ncbi:hypothetical protein TNCV_4840581 [Trichonephila clavipes]|nr:hypothetical protein TNCV_4840581 [Trichonephila clavipes]
MALSVGPRHFEPWSSDEDYTWVGIPSSDFHTPPTGGHLSVDIFNVHRPPLHGRPSVIIGSNSGHASHESVVLTTSLPQSQK